jgi:hypothetical protein
MNIKNKTRELFKKYPKEILIVTLSILLISTINSGVNIMSESNKDEKINKQVKNMKNDVEGIGMKWKKREAIENLERERRSSSAYEIYMEMKNVEELQNQLNMIQARGINKEADSIRVIEIYNKIQNIKRKYE